MKAFFFKQPQKDGSIRFCKAFSTSGEGFQFVVSLTEPTPSIWLERGTWPQELCGEPISRKELQQQARGPCFIRGSSSGEGVVGFLIDGGRVKGPAQAPGPLVR